MNLTAEKRSDIAQKAVVASGKDKPARQSTPCARRSSTVGLFPTVVTSRFSGDCALAVIAIHARPIRNAFVMSSIVILPAL
jgi:hypothetical protein